ncbi:MAG: hypothetical protein H0V29_07745 [Thermoleophilaceae bacterium]|nr:hypothetical protein [Thermoleophilaceae bacterium]
MRLVVICLVGIAFAGCARQEDETLKASCADPDSVEAAIEQAPGAVELEDGVLLSECFPRDAQGSDVQQVGITFSRVATRLAEQRDAVRLGYLVGAARRGAERSQAGVYSELLRRLENELELVDTGTPEFRAAERAGRESG